MFIKCSFTTRWYWQVAWICNFAKLLGAQISYYSCGTGSDFTPHPMDRATRDAKDKLDGLIEG